MRTRTMVVARDTDLRAYLARLLHRGGYSVDLAESAEHARRIGFGNCKVALVAPDGLGDGADDLLAELQAIAKTLLISPSLYPLGPVPAGVIDPSNDEALLTRVADALRPARDAVTALMLHFADWRLDVAGHSLFDREGTEIPLTRGEFNVLRAFLQRPGHVLSREHLLHTLSGREAEPYDRAIDMFIVRLRRKIEPDPKRPTLIRTVPGAGYKFTAAVRRTTADWTDAGSTRSNDDLSPQAQRDSADRRPEPHS
jgi:two-component system OmpR family response regulator